MQRDPLCGPGETVYFFHTLQTYPLMLGTSQMDTKEGDLLMWPVLETPMILELFCAVIYIQYAKTVVGNQKKRFNV